jgi:hypothetical protein
MSVISLAEANDEIVTGTVIVRCLMLNFYDEPMLILTS